MSTKSRQTSQSRQIVGSSGNDEPNNDASAGVAAQLDHLRSVSNDELGVFVVRSGACFEALPNGDRPGWLFDYETPPAVAAGVCARCPVADECLELELRLFGAERMGMWGALGEDGRLALHPVWQRRRDGQGATDTGDAR